MPLPKKMPKANGRSKKRDVGRVFANRYRVEKRLGSGSFGTVFLVEDMVAKGERKVLKEIHVGELPPDETVDAMREARLLSNLDHPNIVKFLDSFLDGESFCIVTEYCEGGDLDDKIRAWKKAGKHFDESLIVAWFIQLLLAVQYMHTKRILHRDLKTRNIFLKNNMIKLGDFGISRILMGTSDMATTFTGTPYYMSPEVLKHEGYNAKSDIWSLGVVLYELCNLEHAFQGQNLMGVMYKIVEGSPPELAEGYSGELRKVYAQMLEKDPSKRPNAANVIRNSYVSENMKQLKLKMNEIPRGDPSLSLSKNSSRTWRRTEQRRLYDEPETRPLTPSERLRLRKQQKADEEAEKLKQIVAQQAAESRAHFVTHKKKQNRVSLPWVQEHPDVFSDPTFTITVAEASSLSPSPPLSPSAPRDVSQLISGQESSIDVEEADLSLSLTGESDIPEDAELAETFYSQFEDEFEDDEDMSSGEEDYSALVGHMESALESSASWGSGTATQYEDSLSEGMSGSMRQRRINGLRAECEKLLGQEAFERVYKYLKEVRFGADVKDEESVMDGLKKIVDKPRDCFLVDQLLFMEKQAEIAAMT